ncbi:MAG: PepSY domain-containing protein [Thermomicrobiales bacterium]
MMKRRKLAAGLGGLTIMLGTLGGGIAISAAGTATNTEIAEAPIDPSTVTTTADQAKAAVLANYPGGKIGQVELQDENGALVWGVIVTDSSGKVHDIKVAGNRDQIVSDQSDDGAEGSGAPESGN